jgi:hypothetical protein
VRVSVDSEGIENVFCKQLPEFALNVSEAISNIENTNIRIIEEFNQICLSEVRGTPAAKIVRHLLTNRRNLKDGIDLRMEFDLFAGVVTLEDLIELAEISDSSVSRSELLKLLNGKLSISAPVAPVEQLNFADIVEASARALKTRDPNFTLQINSLGAIPVEPSCVPPDLRDRIKTFADLAIIAREFGVYEDSAPVSGAATEVERNAAAKNFLLGTKLGNSSLAEVLIKVFKG